MHFALFGCSAELRSWVAYTAALFVEGGFDLHQNDA